MAIGVDLNDNVDVVWRPGEASEALDDEMEVTNKQRLIAGAAHQEGAHVGLQKLPETLNIFRIVYTQMSLKSPLCAPLTCRR